MCKDDTDAAATAQPCPTLSPHSPEWVDGKKLQDFVNQWINSRLQDLKSRCFNQRDFTPYHCVNLRGLQGGWVGLLGFQWFSSLPLTKSHKTMVSWGWSAAAWRFYLRSVERERLWYNGEDHWQNPPRRPGTVYAPAISLHIDLHIQFVSILSWFEWTLIDMWQTVVELCVSAACRRQASSATGISRSECREWP